MQGYKRLVPHLPFSCCHMGTSIRIWAEQMKVASKALYYMNSKNGSWGTVRLSAHPMIAFCFAFLPDDSHGELSHMLRRRPTRSTHILLIFFPDRRARLFLAHVFLFLFCDINRPMLNTGILVLLLERRDSTSSCWCHPCLAK